MRQATAWHLMHCIREAFSEGDGQPFPGPVEADETYVGGKRKNMSKAKRKALKGMSTMTAVVGTKDRETKKVAARPVERTTFPTSRASSSKWPRRAPKSTWTRAHGSITRRSTTAPVSTSGGPPRPMAWNPSGPC